MVANHASLDARAADDMSVRHGEGQVTNDPFRVTDLADLATATFTPPEYVLQTLIPRGYVTLLSGHGGMGKSMLSLVLASHVVAARDWRGLYPAKLRTVFVSLEDSGELVRLRLRNICKAYELPCSDVEGGLTVLDGTPAATALFTDFGRDVGCGPTAAYECLREHTAGAGFIIIDNASEAFDGLENDRRQVRAFMRMLARLAREENAAVLLLAHIDKQAARFGGNGNSYSGSTAWHNSARSRLALVEEDGSPVLRHEKLNLGRTHDPIPLMFDDRGVLLPRTASSRAQEQGAEDQVVLAALQQVLASGAHVPIATSGPCQAFHALEAALPPMWLAQRDGRRRTHAALMRLQQSGRIRQEAYRSGNRHSRYRWELAQAGECL